MKAINLIAAFICALFVVAYINTPYFCIPAAIALINLIAFFAPQRSRGPIDDL